MSTIRHGKAQAINLIDSSDSFRLLVEGVMDYAIFLLDPAGCVASWNIGAQRIKGYEAGEIIGRCFSCFYPDADIEHRKPWRELELALHEGRVEDEGWRVRKDGSRFWASVSITTLREPSGEHLGFAKITRDLTERKRAAETEQRLLHERLTRIQAESAEQHYHQIADTIPQIIWFTGPDGLPGYFNRRWYEFTGLDHTIPAASSWERVLHPADMAPCLKLWEACQREDRTFEMEYRLRRADGEFLWHLGRSTPHHDESGRVVRWFGSATLIEAQKRAQTQRQEAFLREQAARAEAEAAKGRLQFLLQASSLLSSSLDYETTIGNMVKLAVPALADWCSVHVLGADGALRSLGHAHQDPLKLRRARELAERYPVDRNAQVGIVKVLRTGVCEHYPDLPDELLSQLAVDDEHLQLLRSFGLTSVIIAPLKAQGRTLGTLTLMWAESGRRYSAADVALAEDLALRAATAMENARLFQEAERALGVRESFIAMAAHELRTPLSAIRLQLDGMRRMASKLAGTPEEKLHTRTITALRQTTHMERLINGLLDVSRLSGGRIPLELDDVDLAEVTSEVLERSADLLSAAGCAISLTQEGPLVGRWDRGRLDQIITNLLGNALKYGRGEPIEISLRSDGQRARIVVRDHGIGISPADHARIFERFERAVVGGHYGGFGVGLWTVQQLTAALGGTVHLESALGAGATFSIELPLRTAPG